MSASQAFEAVNATFVSAINEGDAATIASLYTDDCSVLVPNHATLQGRDEVQTFFQEMIDSVAGTTTLDIVDMADAGNIGYQWLAYTLEAQEISDSGRVVEVLKRQPDGLWKIHLSIFNSDRT